MKIKTIPYSQYENKLPQHGNYILGQKKNTNLIVYQAYNDQIADFAITNQRFGGSHYSFSRMTWIKPNFLWMMYRSGWAEKENQTRILAIEMTLQGFEYLLEEGVMTTYKNTNDEESVWRNKLQHSNVRIQWDPDHDYLGQKLERRAVQIGIKGITLEKFNNEFLMSISDITEFVKEQKKSIDADSEFHVIEEEIIDVSESLKKKFDIL